VDPLVDTSWLAERLGEPWLRVADVRWYLSPERNGREEYARGHVPGAIFLDVDTDLSAPGGRPGALCGRHPWPDAAQVARVMSGAGIGTGTCVVAYDDAGGGIAARLWYLLRAHGHDDAAVLDGGIVKWIAEGRPLDSGVPRVEPAVFHGELRPGFVVTKQEMVRTHRDRLVLDARAPERYRGDLEPIDPRPGHVPGAASAPFSDNLEPGPVPVFRPPEQLRATYAALGAAAREPVVYCGSGVTACCDLLALERAGLKGRLYAGSWSEWSADPSLPAERG
jgi:thiosulfate/3-mercaptopyruvate sulfurtransferase